MQAAPVAKAWPWGQGAGINQPASPMSTTITFPTGPILKLARAPAAVTHDQWASALTEERHRLEEDLAALREREDNLRHYESRLRVLQAQLDAERAAAPGAAVPFRRPSSQAPFENSAELQAAWEKLHRARELLAAEQSHLCDDRLKARDTEAEMKGREAALAAREMRVAARENLVALAETVAASAAAEPKPTSPLHRFTHAPFAMAKAVFGADK